MLSSCKRLIVSTGLVLLAGWFLNGLVTMATADQSTDRLQIKKGLCVVLGLPIAEQPKSVLDVLQGNQLQIYFQSANQLHVAEVRKAAESAGLLGSRLFIDHGPWQSIHLAANLADAVLVAPAAQDAVETEEIFRVLHPGGIAVVGEQTLVKPAAEGVDDWSHVYHGPDNNPQSTDTLARAPYLTQFMSEPMFSPMPEVTVAAGGRIFKAFGHIAHKANQNAVLNSLLCINAYNGTVLWRRPLREGFMIHRNTMVATPECLYLGDDESCKIIDAETGEIRDELIVPAGISDGPVWKWMALQDGLLVAMVGGQEVQVETRRSQVPGLGHWPWGMWKGHEYGNPQTNFGFGRTFLAMNPRTKEILWTYRDDAYIDSRGVCMNDDHIFFYSPEKFLGSLSIQQGQLEWKNSDPDLLSAIGRNERAQHYVTGYSTQNYIKCNATHIFFAGPQRRKLVAASTRDGSLLWQKPNGNLQLVLREDGIYCAGPESVGQDNRGPTGMKLSFDGEQLATFPSRRACTRATGSIDSIFYRTTGGTVRVDVASNRAEHIAPMRPPCQDGVIISDGLLFWGPWMCGCQLSLYGHICLGNKGLDPPVPPVQEPQLQTAAESTTKVVDFPVHASDWPSFQHDNQRTMSTDVSIPAQVTRRWTHQLESGLPASAPTIAGGLTFVGDLSGVVQAFDDAGDVVWKTYTAGPVHYPPTVSQGRVFAGSADGRVYAWQAGTGRFLWSYRVAPQVRWLPVYGRLISTWPVAGGVVVQNGIVYAAAGITHYDGTYVAALDAATGKPLWTNHDSGALAKDVNSGISLQGELRIAGNELQFLGGGVYQFARYDLTTGQCLNQPRSEVTSRFQTAFYPYFPDYGRYTPLHWPLENGRALDYLVRYDVAQFKGPGVTALPTTEPTHDGRPASRPNAGQDNKPRQRRIIWQQQPPGHYTGFAVGREAFLGLGHPPGDAEAGFLVATRIADGHELWRHELPATPAKGGVAIDHRQQIVVALENGQVICFGP